MDVVKAKWQVPGSEAVCNRPQILEPCVHWACQPTQILGLGPRPENRLGHRQHRGSVRHNEKESLSTESGKRY